jgi:hypothetical protein
VRDKVGYGRRRELGHLLATDEEGMKVRHAVVLPFTPKRRDMGVIELYGSWHEKPECPPSRDM